MSKRIRPRRIITEIPTNAITFEYIIETLADEGDQVRSEMKHITIHVPTINNDTDLNVVTKRVMTKCKYIPEEWIGNVTDALKEIQQRNLYNVQSRTVDNADWGDFVSDKLDTILELLYGDDDEKQSSLNEIISLCTDKRNLQLMAKHHPLMSALSRFLSDKGSTSRKIVFLVTKIFLAFADFEDFHQTLSNYRVGLLIVNAVDLELRKSEQIEKDSSIFQNRNFAGGSKRSDNILYLCFQILIMLSDNDGVMQKMLKKDFVPMLFKALRSPSRRCIDSILTLMIRTTRYEVAIDEYNKELDPIMKILHLLLAQDHNISTKALCVLYNLSFDYKCSQRMIEADIIHVLVVYVQKKRVNRHFFGILYHLSCFKNIRQSLDLDSLIPFILHFVLSSTKDGIQIEVGAFLINMTVTPFFAEAMLPLIDKLTHQVLNRGDILSSKILRNLSVWTRRLQISIELALESEGDMAISMLTKDPSKYVKHIERDCNDEHPMYFNNYRSFKLWDRHIEKIASFCSNMDDDDLLLEVLSHLNHFTINDMAPSLSWSSICQKYSIIPLLRRCVISGMTHMDINMEAVILCNQICSHVEGALSIAKSKLIRSIMQLCDACDEDTEFVFQILCLCETLLCHDESRKELLHETDAMQFIFNMLNDENDEVKLAAERCLDIIENYGRDEQGATARFAVMIKERRFMIHNDAWLSNIQKFSNLVVDEPT